MDLKGKVTQLSERWDSVRGLAWSPAGDEIWFSAGGSRSSRALWAVSLDGKMRLVHEAPGSLTLWDIAPDGRVLLTRDEERRAIVGMAPGTSTERDLSWLDQSGVADLTPDGRWLLGRDRFGVYVRETNGAPPKFLGLRDGFADALSPDAKMAIGTAARRPARPDSRPASANRSGCRRTASRSFGGARWFPDGQPHPVHWRTGRPAAAVLRAGGVWRRASGP